VSWSAVCVLPDQRSSKIPAHCGWPLRAQECVLVA